MRKKRRVRVTQRGKHGFDTAFTRNDLPGASAPPESYSYDCLVAADAQVH